MVYGILKSMHAVGKGNAVSRKALAALTGLSDRSVRGEIEKERRSGRLICSHAQTSRISSLILAREPFRRALNMEAGGGYYLPADEMEIREYYNGDGYGR